LAVEGAQAVVIDNVAGVFGSESIAAALTADVWADRYLGASRMVRAPMRIVWALTGNNVLFRGDLPRRVVPCDLDARMEHPEDRPESNFQHPDLMDYLTERRSELVVAGLILLRGYVAAGRPKHGKPRMGSFEAWDDLVRGALIWCGAEDPLAGRERIRDGADIEKDSLRGALTAWHSKFGSTPKTAGDVITQAADDSDLKLALAEFARCDLERLTAVRLGHALRRSIGTVVGGLRFEREEGLTHGAARWYVATLTPLGGDGGDGGIF
jgi:hypothetical protein